MHDDLTVRPNRSGGAALAGATAAVSGVSVLVNSYAVHDFPDAVSYTTAKNLVAAFLLALCALALSRRAPEPRRGAPPAPGGGVARLVALAYVGVVGGGIAFALFFAGLARTSAVPAAFLHDTLVVFVGVCAWPLLGERLTALNTLAIAALVTGAVAISGGIGDLSLNGGELLVLVATVLWAGEVVFAKRLLVGIRPERLALVRMGVGAAALVCYLAASGHLDALVRLDAAQIGWILITGTLLACYVGTWFAALARARAIDVTSVLVASAALTALFQAALGRSHLGATAALGIGLVAAGTALVLVGWPRRRRA